MNEPRGRVTVDRDGGPYPGPAEFALAAERAARSRAASVVTAHTASQIITVVSVESADRPSAVTIALELVSEALKAPVSATLAGCQMTHDRTGPASPGTCSPASSATAPL